jgi:hypothetical protein
VQAGKKVVVRWVCSGLLSASFAALPGMAQESSGNNQAQITELPESPGSTLSRATFSKEASPLTAPFGLPRLIAQSSTPAQPAQDQSQSAPSQTPAQGQTQDAPSTQKKQEPVGTAAAEAPNTTGVAASQPAGLAIAPAKQRRRRTIIIRTGAIIGAGIAVGTVIGLTEATSSRPPGAH